MFCDWLLIGGCDNISTFIAGVCYGFCGISLLIADKYDCGVLCVCISVVPCTEPEWVGSAVDDGPYDFV